MRLLFEDRTILEQGYLKEKSPNNKWKKRWAILDQTHFILVRDLQVCARSPLAPTPMPQPVLRAIFADRLSPSQCCSVVHSQYHPVTLTYSFAHTHKNKQTNTHTHTHTRKHISTHAHLIISSLSHTRLLLSIGTGVQHDQCLAGGLRL
jgi:hypothetical protein